MYFRMVTIVAYHAFLDKKVLHYTLHLLFLADF